MSIPIRILRMPAVCSMALAAVGAHAHPGHGATLLHGHTELLLGLLALGAAGWAGWRLARSRADRGTPDGARRR